MSNDFLTDRDPGDEQPEDDIIENWINKLLSDDDYWLDLTKQMTRENHDTPD